jgi:acetyl esterase/lipase
MVEQHNGKLLLMGHSAGGHLVLWAAVTCATPVLQGVVALAPAADLRLAHAAPGRWRGQGLSRHGSAVRPDADLCIARARGGGNDRAGRRRCRSYHPQWRHPTAPPSPKTRLVQLPDSGHFAVMIRSAVPGLRWWRSYASCPTRDGAKG